MDTDKTKKNIQDSEVFGVTGLVEYGEGAIVSRTIIKKSIGTVTLFAFDAGQDLSEHSAPYDALVNVVEGEGVIIIGGVENMVGAGQLVLMPANVPHAVRADQKFKMILTMIREK